MTKIIIFFFLFILSSNLLAKKYFHLKDVETEVFRQSLRDGVMFNNPFAEQPDAYEKFGKNLFLNNLDESITEIENEVVLDLGESAYVLPEGTEVLGYVKKGLGMYIMLLLGQYVVLVNHEKGHMEQARAEHMDNVHVDIPVSLSLFPEGKTTYNINRPLEDKDRANIAIAGIRNSQNLYRVMDTLHEQLSVEDKKNVSGRFSSLVALWAGTDFIRYTINHARDSDHESYHDIENFIEYSDYDKEDVYWAAGLDLLINLPELYYHTMNLIGQDVDYPEIWPRFKGFEISPNISFSEDGGIQYLIEINYKGKKTSKKRR